MFKTSIALTVLTSSVSASLSDGRAYKKIHSFPASDKSSVKSSINSAAAGTWITQKESTNELCTYTASNTYVSNWKMGECLYLQDDFGNTAYTIYSCTTDGSYTTTTYTESTCTTRTADEVETSTLAATCSADSSYIAQTCSYSPDNGFDGQMLDYTFSTKASCDSGSNYKLLNAIATGCSGDGEGESITVTCDKGETMYSSDDCTGTSASIPLSFYTAMNCAEPDEETGEYTSYSCASEEDAFCFHVESKINYKGVEFTYEELKAGKEPECTVPHSPSSKGVIVSTSCGKTVRVTDTHLLSTTKGFQLAYSLKAGDVLFGDYDKELCTVKSVEKEKTVQQYFGLNCVHSEVLASGIRASTFGDFHTLPAWYMTYVGGLLGTDTASSLGEYVAEWYFKK